MSKFWDDFNDWLVDEELESPEADFDYEKDIESDFDDYTWDDWDTIAEEYEDIDIFEWFSELS